MQIGLRTLLFCPSLLYVFPVFSLNKRRTRGRNYQSHWWLKKNKKFPYLTIIGINDSRSISIRIITQSMQTHFSGDISRNRSMINCRQIFRQIFPNHVYIKKRGNKTSFHRALGGLLEISFLRPIEVWMNFSLAVSKIFLGIRFPWLTKGRLTSIQEQMFSIIMRNSDFFYGISVCHSHIELFTV